MERLIADQGVDLALGRKVASAQRLDGGGLSVLLEGDGLPRTFQHRARRARYDAQHWNSSPRGSLEIDRGIVVDRLMQTSVPGIFAAGDVAQAPCLTGGSGIAGLWAEARAMDAPQRAQAWPRISAAD